MADADSQAMPSTPALPWLKRTEPPAGAVARMSAT